MFVYTFVVVFQLEGLYHGLWLTIDFNTFVLWWGRRGEKVDYRAEKVCGVIQGLFCGGSTFVLYRQCCGLFFFAAGEKIV